MPSRTDSTRARLFAAAAELIGERGFHGTTVDDIVARAGVAKGTVYYHFKSKAELFDGLLTEHFTRLSELFTEAVASAPTADGAVRALVHAELSYIFENQAASKLLMSELWRMDREWSETLRVLRERFGTVIAGALARGVESGEFRRDLDVPLASTVLFGTVATGALDWLVFDPARPMAEVESAVAELVLRSVSA
jgi:AcrR family transcriptional regulator